MDITALKPHLGDELFSQVEEKLSSVDGFSVIPTNDGSWLPKARLDEEISKRKPLQDTIKTLTKQLEEAKASGASVPGLQSTIESLKNQIKERDTTIAGMKRSTRIQEALSKANARDPHVVEKLLDGGKIAEDDKGNLTGLDEQIKAIQEASPYLFNEKPGQHGGWGGGKDPKTGSGNNDNADFNQMIRAAAGRST